MNDQGFRKTDPEDVIQAGRSDATSNPADEKGRVNDVWEDTIEEEERWKVELRLEPLIADILEKLYRSNRDDGRILDRNPYHAMNYSDTQITAARRKALKILRFLNPFLDFKNRLDYMLYDITSRNLKDINELKAIRGNLHATHCGLLRNPLSYMVFLDLTLEPLESVVLGTPDVQANQLATEIRKKLTEGSDEDYEKTDHLLTYILKEFLLSDWDNPRIENRKLLKELYTDSQITSARRKALWMWPYIRFEMRLKNEPEGGPLDGVIPAMIEEDGEEIRALKRNVIVLRKRIEELRIYNFERPKYERGNKDR